MGDAHVHFEGDIKDKPLSLDDVNEGDRVAFFYFGDPEENCWYRGTITDLNRRKTTTENMAAKFDVDGQSSEIIASVANYGKGKCWLGAS